MHKWLLEVERRAVNLYDPEPFDRGEMSDHWGPDCDCAHCRWRKRRRWWKQSPLYE